MISRANECMISTLSGKNVYGNEDKILVLQKREKYAKHKTLRRCLNI